ncbi:hypothetical protein [Mycobacterium paraense]|uniref:hypothetical protein n=1 Tax=Mycobacterium paraense TaxID=767916 RepID=UPI001153CA43|nr:hypothetical protein [Mycobacterium paraense]
MKVVVVPVAVMAAMAMGCAPAARADPGVTCAEVGGVFVQHYDDGRGTCMPADPRRKCHIPPDEQDAFDPTGNYLSEVLMHPPYAYGYVDWFDIGLIKGASNADCWKLPS